MDLTNAIPSVAESITAAKHIFEASFYVLRTGCQ